MLRGHQDATGLGPAPDKDRARWRIGQQASDDAVADLIGDDGERCKQAGMT